MKKITKKLMCMTMALACACGATACGGGGGPKEDNSVVSEKKLYIQILKKGYGTAWLDTMAQAYEDKMNATLEEGEEKYDITVHVANDASLLKQSLEMGPSKNAYDLYFNIDNWIYGLRNDYQGRWRGYEDGLMDLTDLYEMEIPGEDITFGDKMLDSVKGMVEFEGVTDEETGKVTQKYFSVPWATGVMGLVYNHDVISAAIPDYKLPNTTNELLDFAGDLYAAGVTPFIYPGQLNQWSGNLLYSWWAQHGGMTDYEMYWEGKTWDERNETYSPSKDLMKREGILKALEVLGEICAEEKGWHDTVYDSYNAQNLSTIQTRFLLKDNKDYKYAMYPCGDWLAEEADSNRDTQTKNFAMMKTPVISSIIERLPSINDDATLSAVIDYVDGTTTELPAGVTSEDVEQVRIARGVSYSKATIHQIYMPAYSNAKDLAYDFLLFMASDEGIELYKDSIKGGFLPFEYDYSAKKANMSMFEQSLVDMMDSDYLVSETKKCPVFYAGGINTMTATGVGMFEDVLGAKKTGGTYKSPQAIYEMMWLDQEAWDLALRTAGTDWM